MEEERGKKAIVCVTGAGGFVASWVVKLLLSEGYMVHGTVRDPCDEKNAHLKKLENAAENLQLFKTDLLDFEGLSTAFAGCTGVFHVACPVPTGSVLNPEMECTNACIKAKVKRVVVVSSVGAVMWNPNWPKGKPMDEECWTDQEYCSYCNEAKMELNLLKIRPVVDVRDVAEALLLVYEKPEAEQRYICNSYVIRIQALVDMLKNMYPNYNYPKSLSHKKEEEENLSSEKLQSILLIPFESY